MVVLYVIFATAIFYFFEGAFTVGGFGIMYRYLLALGIFALAFGAFLVKPNIRRFLRLGRESAVLSLSYLLPVLYSAFIWIFTFADMKIMTRGFFYPMYQIIGLLMAASTLYLFGKKGIRYCLLSMLLANLLIVLERMANSGVGVFLEELATMILSFGLKSGSVIRSMEIHDLTFALGLFFLYDLLEGRKEKGGPVFLLVTLFFLLVGLKRIGLLGIVIAALAYAFLKLFSEKTSRRLTIAATYLIMAVCFLYVLAVKQGLFEYLEYELGINTMSRAYLYRFINQLYEVSPAYFGKGLGFSNVSWSDLGLQVGNYTQYAFHNDFLRMFVEIGFYGFLLWLWLMLPYRVSYFWKKKGKTGGLMALACTIYCCVTYATDNTLYYFNTNIALFLLTMACGMEEQEKKESCSYE